MSVWLRVAVCPCCDVLLLLLLCVGAEKGKSRVDVNIYIFLSQAVWCRNGV